MPLLATFVRSQVTRQMYTGCGKWLVNTVIVAQCQKQRWGNMYKYTLVDWSVTPVLNGSHPCQPYWCMRGYMWKIDQILIVTCVTPHTRWRQPWEFMLLENIRMAFLVIDAKSILILWYNDCTIRNIVCKHYLLLYLCLFYDPLIWWLDHINTLKYCRGHLFCYSSVDLLWCWSSLFGELLAC